MKFLSPLNMPSIAGDPASPANGDVWYNTSLGALRMRVGGVTYSVPTSAGSAKGVVRVLAVTPPATSYATPDVRAGGSSPAENWPCFDFDDSTIEYVDYLCRLEGYSGGGLTITLAWAATSATSGNVIWGAAVRRVNDDAEDMDSSQTYDFNDTSGVAAPSASGELSYDDITFTDGVDMDSLANGEVFMLRIRRNASSGSDTMSGDAELVSVYGRET